MLFGALYLIERPHEVMLHLRLVAEEAAIGGHGKGQGCRQGYGSKLPS